MKTFASIFHGLCTLVLCILIVPVVVVLSALIAWDERRRRGEAGGRLEGDE